MGRTCHVHTNTPVLPGQVFLQPENQFTLCCGFWLHLVNRSRPIVNNASISHYIYHNGQPKGQNSIFENTGLDRIKDEIMLHKDVSFLTSIANICSLDC